MPCLNQDLLSWCFEPGQPYRVMSGLSTFALSILKFKGNHQNQRSVTGPISRSGDLKKNFLRHSTFFYMFLLPFVENEQHVCVCVCVCARMGGQACMYLFGSLRCMNEIVTTLNLNFIYLSFIRS